MRKAPAKKAAKSSSRGMSQAEFGKHIDVSQQRVAQMLASGTIEAMANGRIDPDAARIAYIRTLRRSPGSEEARRVAAARARAIEIQNEKQLGSLIELEEVIACNAEIIGELCREFSGIAAASTRDLELRAIIQQNVDAAINRCKRRFADMADAAAAGRPLTQQQDSGEDDEN